MASSTAGPVTPLSAVEAKLLAAAVRPIAQGHSKRISALAWSTGSDSIVATGSGDSTVKLWAIDGSGQGPKAGSSATLRGHTGSVEALAWAPEPGGAILASGASERAVKLWDTRSGKATNTISIKGQPLSMVWTHDGSGLAVGSRDDSLSLIDTRKGRIAATVQFSQELNEFAITPEGLLYAALVQRSVTDDGYVGVYKLQADLCGLSAVGRVSAHTSTVLQLRFSPDGKQFVTGSADSCVTIWDAGETAAVRMLDRADSQIRALAWSGDSSLLAVSAGDKDDAAKTLDIVRVADGSRVRTISLPQAINHVAWAPHAPLLAFAIDDQKMPPGTAFDAGCLRLLAAV